MIFECQILCGENIVELSIGEKCFVIYAEINATSIEVRLSVDAK